MLKISEFAGITGLSVKALRHYDEKSVLAPQTVDSTSGFRWYAEGQVREGVMVRALRAAGVPLHSMASIDTASSAIDVLESHREKVIAARAEEDRAYANDAFSELYGQLTSAGIALSGRFWTSIRSGANGNVELVGCWEVPEDLSGKRDAEGDVVDTLPDRTEIVAVWSPTADEQLLERVTHPAIVAMFDALDERQIELGSGQMEIRQTVIGQSDSDYSVEVSIIL